MNTIFNKIRFALLLGFVTIGMAMLAQGVPYINKMSVTTQMFLDEMEGKINFDELAPPPSKTTSPGMRPLPKVRRPIVTPDTIDGKVYISATVRLADESSQADLESKGVIVQCTFDNGLLTTLIPIDRIDEVAAIEGVTRINVASYLQPSTKRSRQASNVDDVLTLSADAQNAGLSSIYDGSGVILGVIDDGIDYQHGAFKDKNGNSRIKGAYCYNGSRVTADWTGSGTLPTTDDTSEDHGTHTSTIAGGSSVIVSGTNVTVTDNHANATYGGMAPGADMFLAGTQLATTYVMNAFQRMCNYADQQGKPLVVSNSWSSAIYSRDGYSDMSDVLGQYFGDSHPNRICLFASGNEAGMAIGGQGGGRYVTGASTEASPVGTIVRSDPLLENYYGYQYYSGIQAVAWTRAANAQGIGVNIHVINKNTGALSQSYTYTSTNNAAQNSVTLTSLNMTLYIYFDYVSSNGKHMALFYVPNAKTTSSYVFAIEAYPIGGSSNIIDIFGGDWTYLTGYTSTNGHNWQYGTDDLSMSDEPMNPNVISVGSYVTWNGENSTGDISDFSSYSVEGVGPQGVMHPWITAPGEVIISGLNHYVSANNHGTVTVNNANSPYGEMSGTSMATPAAAGIVALWFQAAQEEGIDLTLSDVKEIMKETATHDQWTNGTHASHFGNGKINALAGIEYILSEYGSQDPVINASPASVDFSGEPNQTYSETIVVGGRNLNGDITATLNDPNGVYSINTTNLGSGGDLVITYLPTEIGSHNATITLTSPGAEPVTITINGTAAIKTDATVADGSPTTNNTVPVYGNQFNRVQTNQMLYPASMFTGKGMDGKTIKKFTFYPNAGILFRRANTQSGTITFKFANMPANTAGYTYNNPTRKTADFVTVKTITIPTTTQPNLTEWVFEDLENDFVYNGGDLLIEVTTTTGTNGDTYFIGEELPGQVYQSYYSYVRNNQTTSRGLRFLPKVTFEWDAVVEPITAGEVSPSALTFTDVAIGKSEEQTVTVSNTGTLNFTPVIDTTNLPSEFTVTGNGQVLPDGTLDLTVTYTPTSEETQSGSFTITIGDQTFTVTVTGNGIVVNSTLTSNTVEVPAFHSDTRIGGFDKYIFTQQQVYDDVNRQLAYDDEGDELEILVKSDERITHYNLMHRDASNDTWEVASTALHQGDKYVSDATEKTFPTGETEMWFSMTDEIPSTSPIVYYVPVTFANGVITQGNTYGAPYSEKETDYIDLYVSITGSKSSEREGGYWTQNGVEYCVYTPIIHIVSDALDGISHVPYIIRAWLLSDEAYDFTRVDGAIVGTTPLTSPYLLGEKIFQANEQIPDEIIIGEEWESHQNPDDDVKLQNAFGAPCVGANIRIVVRAYYQKGAGYSKGLRDGEGGYAFSDGGGEGNFDLPTGVMEINGGKQVADVTYVNALGMQSSEPFDGVNIVVTRYSDGTITTTKVMR